jgi:hypothetical protein
MAKRKPRGGGSPGASSKTWESKQSAEVAKKAKSSKNWKIKGNRKTIIANLEDGMSRSASKTRERWRGKKKK